MARYNAIYAGPVTDPTPHAFEALAAVALTPGNVVVLDGGTLALSTANTTGKVWIVQDNYLTGRGVSTQWPQDSRAIALELVSGKLYRALVPTGQNLTHGDALTTGPNGTLVKAGAEDMVVATAGETFNNDTGDAQLVEVRPATGYVTAA